MTTTTTVAEAAVGMLRAAVPPGDPAGESAVMWRIAVEQQWHLLAVPESAGGFGGDLADLAAVVRAVAGAGLSTPLPELYAAVFAGADPQAATVALPLGGGELLVPWGRWSSAAVVLDGGGAVLPAGGLREAVNLAYEPVDELTHPAGGGSGAGPALSRWRLLHTARLAGAMAATARRTAAYAEARVQFGRPVARFQAVAALVAEAHAQSVLTGAALDVALSDPDDEVAVLSGHAVAARAAGVVARIAHQVHGAVGVTRELGLERLTRRLWAWRDLWQPEFVVEAALAAGVAAGGEEYCWPVVRERGSGAM